jgi:hypothetical protein
VKDDEHFQKWMAATLRKPDKNQYLPDMRFAEYADAPGVNGSTFLHDTCEEMLFEAQKPHEPDYTLTLGEMIHMAILEPDFFEGNGVEERFQFSPTVGLDTKAALQAFAADPTKPLVTQKMLDKARYMRDAVIGPRGNSLAKNLLSAKADRELSGFAWHEEQQLMVKTRVDFRPINGNFLLDIKSANGVGSQETWSGIRKWGYHCKAAFYIDVDAIISGKMPRPLFFFLMVSGPKGPSQGVYDGVYQSKVYEVASPVQELSLIEEGRAIYKNRLAMFGNACRTGDFEGYQHQDEAEVLTVFRPRSVARKQEDQP